MVDNNEIIECPNCGLTSDPSERYCSHCGQKSVLPGLSLTALIKEYVDIVFNFENRIWVSMVHLLVPGKLSICFFEGKRQKYLSPLRIFLIFGLLHFTLFGHWINKNFDKQLTNIENSVRENAFKEQFIQKIEALPNNIFVEEGLDSTQMVTVKSSLYKELAVDSLPFPIQNKDSLDNDFPLNTYHVIYLEYVDGKWVGTSFPLRFADLYYLDNETIISKANAKTSFGKWQVRQEIKILKEIKNFTFFVTGQLIWTVIFTMLLISFFQRILYFRQPYFYAHHLIFQLHFHAFSFLTVSLFMLGNRYKMILDNFNLFILIILLYQTLALRKIFKQGWLKTIGKVMAIDSVYIILSISIFLVAVIINMLRY
jgi:hypothetical protein